MKHPFIACLFLLVCLLAACTESSPMLKGWPADIPQYPGSTVIIAQDISVKELTFLMVALNSTDSVDAITSFYDQLAVRNDYKAFFLFQCSGGAMGFYVKGNVEFQLFTANTADGNNYVLLRIMSPAEPVKLHVEGSLPPSFPLRELSPYPGSTIQTAASRETESVLLMETPASFDEVADYYSSVYEAYDYSVEESPLGDMSAGENGMVIDYSREGTSITLDIGKSLNGNTLVMLWEKRESGS